MTGRAHAELHMIPGIGAPAHARRWVDDTLEGSELASQVVDDARLVVDELVTNAILYAATPIVVTLAYSSDECRSSVHDERVDGPAPTVVEREDGTGRGLRLVNAIASAWGVERSGSGTTVWAEIRP